jgi:TetR/AcrR family transcriptional regulator
MAEPARKPPSRARTPRAERRRAAILAEAERLFAERGSEGTRLEDVAEAVGIRRASIVYYFRSKAELYDAVLASVLGDLHRSLEQALAGSDPLAARIERAVRAWIGCVGRRPSLARLLLREVAGAAPDRHPALLAHLGPFFALARRVAAGARGDPLARSLAIDPVELAGTLAGATVFLVAAMPALLPDSGFDPLRADRLASHERTILRITERLLGMHAPRRRPTPARRRRRAR